MIESSNQTYSFEKGDNMDLSNPLIVAAAQYSLLYLLFGGGLGGALVIYVVAKMLGK